MPRRCQELPRQASEARNVCRTEDPTHPSAAAVLAQGDTLVGGPVTVLGDEESTRGPSSPYASTPAQTRTLVVEKGWCTGEYELPYMSIC